MSSHVDSSDQTDPNSGKLDCPDEGVLRSLLDEQLDSETTSQLTVHIETCADCVRQLQELFDSVGDRENSQVALDPPGWNEQRAQVIAQTVAQPAIDIRPAASAAGSATVPRIPGYGIDAVIGQGGMGTVFRATEQGTGREVAIKTLSASAFHDAEAARRFEREIRLTRRCVHPHIVQSVASGEYLETPYLVMEYVDGSNLAELTRHERAFSVADSCELIRQAALGLHHAHELGLVHRDVKPSNLLLNRRGVVKLADLGLARFSDRAGEASLTSTHQVMGSIDYMAPEQARAGDTVDRRADIYSLGATLLKLLTGAAPFETAEYDSPLRKVAALATASSPDIQHRRDDLPSGLADIVNRMLSFDQELRYATAKEVADALAPYCEDHQVEAIAATVSKQVSGPLEGPTVSVDDSPTPALRSHALPNNVPTRRPLWRISAAAGILLAGFAFIAMWATDGGKIRVKCDDLELLLEIIRDGELIQVCAAGELEDSTWFRSGDYEIRLPAESQDAFTIANGSFTLTRDDRQLVVIQRVSALWSDELLSVSPSIWNSEPVSVFTQQHRSVDILTSADWEWTPPRAFLPAINDGATPVHYPTLTPDGLTLMFGRLTNFPESGSEETRILVAVRASLESPFQVRYEIPTPIKWPKWPFGMHLAKYERAMLYFAEKESDVAFRNTDLFCLRYANDGAWGTVDLFQNVNTQWNEKDPTVSADGRLLIFSSRRIEGEGDYDLWMATREAVDVPFESPVSMGFPINTPGHEGFAELSSDSLVLIYNSYVDVDQTNSFMFATRRSTDEEFSNPCPLELPCDPDMTQRDAALALNGRLLVFRQRPVTDPLKLTLHYCQRVPKSR